QEGYEALMDAIRQLPPSEQRLIRLKCEDMSVDEISRQTGIPKRSVSVMLSTARKRLLTILKRKEND
ncbi:MAG: sigma-70 family RNA polymerase sigma factor, partial [Bacteroidaceae bacterium]|nr:sigma-70 family RNA polymerase sigma factor [Bacteroidaceae bacterium]